MTSLNSMTPDEIATRLTEVDANIRNLSSGLHSQALYQEARIRMHERLILEISAQLGSSKATLIARARSLYAEEMDRIFLEVEASDPSLAAELDHRTTDDVFYEPTDPPTET